MPQIDVIGLGASTVDVLSLVDHLPAEDEVLRASDISIQGGGRLPRRDTNLFSPQTVY